MTGPTITPAAAAMLAALAPVWGGTFCPVEMALREPPPMTSVLFRVGLAVPVPDTIPRLERQPLPRGAQLRGPVW